MLVSPLENIKLRHKNSQELWEKYEVPCGIKIDSGRLGVEKVIKTHTFKELPFKALIVSQIGIIPKSQPAYRMIHHLSYPEGELVNDGIDQE